jgi:hypothetical protein
MKVNWFTYESKDITQFKQLILYIVYDTYCYFGTNMFKK